MNKSEIWFVDDRKDIESLAEYVQMSLVDRGVAVLCTVFHEAITALTNLEQATTLPQVIVLDGNLDHDRPPLNRGAAVAQQISANPQWADISLIGFSNDRDLNTAILKAGGQAAFEKLEYSKLIDYLADKLKA